MFSPIINLLKGSSLGSSSSSSSSSKSNFTSSSAETCDHSYNQTYVPPKGNVDRNEESDKKSTYGQNNSIRVDITNENQTLSTENNDLARIICELQTLDETVSPIQSSSVLDTSNTYNNVSLYSNNEASSSIGVCNTNTSSAFVQILVSPPKKGAKRKREPQKWKKNISKELRNTGKEYKQNNGNVRKQRAVQPTCNDKCRLKCADKFTDDERSAIFSQYWKLGDINKQRQYILKSMELVKPRYRYVRQGGSRGERANNNAFYFSKDGERIRICKTFFRNTLDINDRVIQTVIKKHKKLAELVLETDQRGKHSKHKTIDPCMIEGIRNHINSIPRIESQYLCQKSSKQYIDGSKSIADIHRDYVNICKEKQERFASYSKFRDVFMNDFNISFFTPKKDQCENCISYENADGPAKETLRANYEHHINEKYLSRIEMQKDKGEFEGVVAVYELQAVLQLPKGEASSFYYTSKLNVQNFTIYNLKVGLYESYVWHEASGHCGVNELGSCVLLYLQKIAAISVNANVIFYSDNCIGQQKNCHMLAVYFYAVHYLGIKSIEHKYLIEGHTQNEGDSIQSLIKRQMKKHIKAGPIFTPESFVCIIRDSKKNGPQINVNEMRYEDFHDIEKLADDLGFPKQTAKFPIPITEARVIRVDRDLPFSICYKKSFCDLEFESKRILKANIKTLPTHIALKPAFIRPPSLDQKKKSDLMELVKKNSIPKMYQPFYDSL